MDRKAEIVELTSAQLELVSGGLDFSPMAANAVASALTRASKPQATLLKSNNDTVNQIIQKMT